ncbi:hypothetical protein HOB87_09675 [Candidatus Woesearchaeota archaeon]|jgi:hypothetical protein|nr:hypothetical protein [Candidatus Woesearchaeota archaeon]
MKDNTMINWTNKLKEDLIRINKSIHGIRHQVDVGIDQLRILEKERENILSKCLGECDE